MVVFTCNHCGDSLRKPAVEKHYNFVCRTAKSLTCVDCFKDFRNEEYVVHIKCISEEERYAAKGSMPLGAAKKGEIKQEAWVDMIKSIICEETSLKSSLKDLLNTISGYSNVPRKKPKFMNFIKSSSGGRVNIRDIEDVWNIIEKYKIKNASQSKPILEKSNEITNLNDSRKRTTTEDNSSNNIETEQPLKKKKKKKSEAGAEEENDKIENITKEENCEDVLNGNVDSNQPKKNKKKINTEVLIEENGQDIPNDIVKNLNKKENCEDVLNGNVDSNQSKKKKKKTNTKVSIEENGQVISNNDIVSKQSKELVPQEDQEENNVSEKFDFSTKIINILENKKTISLKKLQKKVINAYLANSGKSEVTDKIVKKFNNRLKKIHNVEITENTVSLKEM